ncbi:MAG: serine/threonine protein kinase [Planctomycetes bacterium]|nr:serine/threonine protein kinase [Planctomycetota bacterium]
MKLVKGRSLESIVRGIAAGDPGLVAKYPLRELLRVFLKVCDAVAFAHNRGVLHRDLKPENVMVGEFGEVQVMDWGLAKVTAKPDSPDRASRETDSPDSARSGTSPKAPATKASDPASGGGGTKAPGRDTVRTIRSHADGMRTMDGAIMGTPSYMSPEQADGRLEEIDERSDVFALGGILYTLLVHEPLYTGATAMNMVTKAARAEFVPPRQAAPALRVPAELESACLKALAREKADRYASAADLAADVQAFLEHRLVSAHRYGPAARALRLFQRHPAASLAAATALILASLGGGAVAVLAARARAEEAQRKEAETRADNESLRAAGAEKENALAQVRAESAEKDRALAQKRAAEATEALAKGRQVAAVVRAAHGDLSGVAEGLKRVYWSGDPPEKRREAAGRLWGKVEAFEAAVPSDPASRSTWLAIRYWFRKLSGDREAALADYAAAREADPDNATAPLFRAMSLFADYMAWHQFPAYSVRAGGVQFHRIPGESPQMQEIRKNLEKAIEEARGSKVWGESSAPDFQAALAGFMAVPRSDLALAEEGLTKALMVPELAWIRPEIRFARAKARLLRKALPEALGDLEAVTEADCLGVEPVYFEAQTLSCLGYEAEAKGEPALAWFRRAIEAYTAVRARRADNPNVLNPRGQAWLSVAREQIRLGEDPEESFREALEDLDENVRRGDTSWAADYNVAVAHNSRGNAYGNLAEHRASRGGDAVELYRLAMRDFLDALHSKLTYPSAMPNFFGIVGPLARHLAQRGGSVEAFLSEWADREGEAAERDPRAWGAALDRGLLLEALGAYDEAERSFRRAVEAGATAPVLETWIQRVRGAASEPAWARDLSKGERAIQWGDFRLARETYERGLAAAEASGAAAEEKNRDRLAGSRYNLACALSLLSAGIRAAGAAPAAADPAESGALRARAVGELRKSLELGWKDLEHLRRDKDLDPLRADPAFQALLDEWKKRLDDQGSGEGKKGQ